jgi:acyl carrier protein
MSVEEKVIEVVAKNIRKLDIDFQPTTTLENLDASYLDIIEMVTSLEDYYDIEITDEELQKIEKIGDLISCVKRKIAMGDLISRVEREIAEGDEN